MADKVKRIKTNYKNIYYNEKTKRYDVKYNYKEYDPLQQKNKYKAQWGYNCATIGEAKETLAKMQAGITKTEDKDITLAGALELWKIKAELQQYSVVTIHYTEQYMKAIYKFLPANTKLKDITENTYYDLFSKLKKKYSDETIHTLNSTFKKLIKLAYKRGLIADNFLYRADSIKTKQKDDYRLITHDEFKQIDEYLDGKKDSNHGYNTYPRLRFLYNTLYYTGMRLGEVLALTWEDFEEFNYYSAEERDLKENFRLIGTSATDRKHLSGLRISVTKSSVRIKDKDGKPRIKEPKNNKNRKIPIPPSLELMYYSLHERHKEDGGKDTDKVFGYCHSYALQQIKETCQALGIEHCTCHAFRHTYISNLVKHNVPISVIEQVSGDTQETILKRYSHMFEQDEVLVLKALENL